MLTPIPQGAIPGLTLVAWVQYDVVAAAVRRSYNVSGVVKNATGAFTISFANALAGTDYLADILADSPVGVYGYMFTRLAGSVRCDFVQPGAANTDPQNFYVGIYR